MKITIAQINTTPNDFEGNFSKILNGINSAISDDSDVVVFPELSIPGYLVRDLVYTHGFIEKNLLYLQKIAELTKNAKLTVIVGYIDRNYKGYGKPFRNMAAIIQNGVISATYQKRLLPAYNVFEEFLYFEPGTEPCIFKVNNNLCSVLICEDLWRSDKGETGNIRYKDDPITQLKDIGVNYIFSINSSPYSKNKPIARINLLKSVTKNWNNPINLIYVNQIGGNDELIFDGHSCVISNGDIYKLIQTDILPKKEIDIFKTMDIPAKGVNCSYFTPILEFDHLKMVLLGLYDYVTKSGFSKIVIGSSGGIDSALVATLSTLAFGPTNVNCIMMPSIYSSEGSLLDAKQLHTNLKCNEYLVPIKHEDLLHTINSNLHLENYNTVADENLQARMRGQIVMHFSNATGALSLTTGNKTELSVSYSTLFGDMAGTFNPIGDLYKCEVYEMARIINMLYSDLIPTNIINKAPSAELRPGQTDEQSLLPYPLLDEICRLYIEDYVTDYETYYEITKSSVTKNDYNRITRLIYNSEFKRRQACPTIKLSKVAFGTGRRLPIVKK